MRKIPRLVGLGMRIVTPDVDVTFPLSIINSHGHLLLSGPHCTYGQVLISVHRADVTRCSYSLASEILGYFKGIADEYGLRKYIRLSHRVVGATWDEHDQQWHVRVQRGGNPGDVFEDRGYILVNASGVLK